MDLDLLLDLFKGFGFILIPLIIKSIKDKEKIDVTNRKRNLNKGKSTLPNQVGILKEDRIEKKHPNHEINIEKYRTVDKVQIEKSKINNNIENTINNKEIEKDYKEFSYTKEEVKSKKINLNFDGDEIVKGIIMAEILSKPKSLQRK